jgi:hypothetical protein
MQGLLTPEHGGLQRGWAWRDLQRIPVPQEWGHDEVERSAAGSMWATAALMWLFLAGLGLDLPGWGVGLAIAAYGVLLSVPAVLQNCRSAWPRPEGIAWPSGNRAKAQRTMSAPSPCSAHAAPRCRAKCQGLYG